MTRGVNGVTPASHCLETCQSCCGMHSCGLPDRCLRFWCLYVVILIWDNLTYNLQLGIRLGFDFLKSQASFDIGKPPHSLQSSQQLCSSHVRGAVQLLRVIVLGLILTTILGVIAGLPVSDNWLVRQIALVYVEIFRNTPLLLQLFFWYFAVS